MISARAAFRHKAHTIRHPLYTTYFQAARFGGEYNDCGIEIHAIAVDRNGDADVAGCTSAVDFPVVRPLVASLRNSRGGAFLAKLDPSGVIVYSTYFRASNATAIAADGNAYLVGTPMELSTRRTCDYDACLRATPRRLIPGVIEMNWSSLPSSTSTKANLSGPNGVEQTAVPVPF